MSTHVRERLSELISRFHERLALYGCTTRVGPFIGQLVENDVMPMLVIDRWATGPDQLDGQSYRRLRKALQLATLLLTEDSTLGWFCHYTFGHRKKASGRTYISPTNYSTSQEAIQKVKRNMRELGKVIVFMFTPASDIYDAGYGATYGNKRNLPFFHRFRKSDWPKTPNGYRKPHPVVVMHSDFCKYFSQKESRQTDHDTWLRTQFLFATTLVHEIVHAYGMWLGKDHGEPRWGQDDKEAELGFSWENETLGYICNPLFHDINGCKMLLSIRAISYKYGHEQPDIVRRLIGQHPLHFNFLHPTHFQDLFRFQGYRGRNFYAGQGSNPRRSSVVAIYALSLEWIAGWFDERHWEQRRCMWRQRHEYIPPPLGTTFVLVYQKNGGKVLVHYPLNPRIEEDVPYIPYAAEQERLRGNKLPSFPESRYQF